MSRVKGCLRQSLRPSTPLVAVLSLAMVAGAGVVGTGSAVAASKASAHRYTIGFSNPQGTQPVLDEFQSVLTKAGAREGITVKSLNAALTVGKQVSDIQQFINEKVKAIVVFPLAGPPLVPVLTAARKAGIPVLGYNAITTSKVTAAKIYPFTADINQNIVNEGAKLAAAFVAKKLKGKGNVLGVDIAAPVPSLHAFMASEQADVTRGHPGIHWLETVSDVTDNIAGAATPVADALTKYHGKVAAVMAYFDGAAIGASHSLKAAGVKAVVVGQQGNETGITALKKGEITATIDIEPYNEGLIALTMVKDLVSGKKVPLVVTPPVTLITKQNLKSYVPWSKALTEIAKGKLKPPTKLTAVAKA